MALKCGIVGLPNVGKSTLFNCLSNAKAQAANFPFCTIEPNVGVITVPDDRLEKLEKIVNPERVQPTTIEIVDIAGLVKGASKGEGLGNKFLANIRETDAIIHVLRCFKNEKIINTLDNIDPLLEKETLEMELTLKDLEVVDKRLSGIDKEIKLGAKEAIEEKKVLIKAQDFLQKGSILYEEEWDEEEKKILNKYQLLTLKPKIYLLNGHENEVPAHILEVFNKNKWPYLIMDVAMELETVGFSAEERVSFGLPEQSELDLLIKLAYDLLGLITFLTTGEDETRAWTLRKGLKAPQAGGVIHSDFADKFIKAEIIDWKKLIESGNWSAARQNGWIRLEGKEYEVQDGDVIIFKHGG